MAPLWEALVPEGGFPGVTFTFDPDDQDYDFLAVYEDLPPLPGEKKIMRTERLACPKWRTLLITTEPSSIRVSGPHYLSQFGMVWTSVPYTDFAYNGFEDQTLIKPAYHGFSFDGPLLETHFIREKTPPLRWFYGRDMEGDHHLTIRDLARETPSKSKSLSTVTSDKAMKHTVHSQRLAFVKALKERLGDQLNLFGRGFNSVSDKAQAMRDYRYHLAIENHIQPGHHTEKLTDSFIAECLPFYFGDPDYDKAYPRDAVIPINIRDLDASVGIILKAIEEDAYSARQSYILQAKKKALHLSNPLSQAYEMFQQKVEEERAIKARYAIPDKPVSGVIHGRHAFRRAYPFLALRDAYWVARMKRSPIADPLQGLPALRSRISAQ
jgi:hypothetical protein